MVEQLLRTDGGTDGWTSFDSFSSLAPFTSLPFPLLPPFIPSSLSTHLVPFSPSPPTFQSMRPSSSQPRLSTQPQPPLGLPPLQRLLPILRLDPAQEPVSALLHQPRRAAHRRARAAADLGAQPAKRRMTRNKGGGGEEVEDFAVDADRSGGSGRGGRGCGDGVGGAEDGTRKGGGTEGGEDGE